MKLLKKLYEISSPSGKEQVMRLFIKSLLLGMKVDYSEDKHGNIYATKGDSDTYPCIVCHTDEVHGVRPKGYRVVESDGIILGINIDTLETEGIGADDKNGIWVCLKALNDFDVMKCAFFVSEEIGCVGSMHADMKFFDDCRFVLQCDRKGYKDFIIDASGVELCSSEFVEAVGIHQFGYEVAHGLMTDVMTLKERGLQVSACNISCGYYNPHSETEMTRIEDLMNCYELVKHIVSACTGVYPHEFDYDDTVVGCYGKTTGSIGDYWDDRYSWNDCDWNTYSEEYDNMSNAMYNYSLENENFSLKAFIEMCGKDYKFLDKEDFEYACEEIMGCVTY